jgi:hypothetical protein
MVLNSRSVSSSRPSGTFRLSNSTQDWRPGLSSAVPAGLILRSPGSHADPTQELSQVAGRRFWVETIGDVKASVEEYLGALTYEVG